MAKKTTMKIGFQTIVWWPFTDPLEYRLEVIAGAGYQGVEFKERPDELPPIEELQKLLKKYNLELIGLSGGSLKSRIKYCKNVRPDYLYTDDWNEEIARLVERTKNIEGGEFILALHPHVFKPAHSLGGAKALLEKFHKLKFIPDTAHLTIVGDDPVEAIQTCSDRLAAVHLKDWTPEYGRSAHRYARGFVELGEGTIDLDRILMALNGIDYEGWLIVEQDSTKGDPAISTLRCAGWLAKRGLMPVPPAKPPARSISRGKKQKLVESETPFLKTAVSAVWQDIESCYESIARGFLNLCQCELVTFWTCSPAHELLNLVAVAPEYGWDLPIEQVLNYREVLSGIAMEEQKIQRFDLTKKKWRDQFGCKELLKTRKFKGMVSIPVFNPWNPNHVRLIVNILHEKNNVPIDDKKLEDLAVAVGYSTTSVLDELCLTSAAKVNMLIEKDTILQSFVNELALLVAKLVNCQEVAILLTTPSGTELELLSYVGDEWMAKGLEVWYEKRKKSIERVWDSKETLILPREETGTILTDRNKEAGVSAACTVTPFIRADAKVLGLIYCCIKRSPRKLGTSKSFAFCDDDCAILEAIGQAAVPHMEILGERERLEKMLGRLTHELKVPLVAIRGAIDFIERTPGIKKLFDYDYPGDIESWCELMGRLIDNADAFRYSNNPIEIKATKTSILRDVIAPAIRQVRLLLRERGFSPKNISYTKEQFQGFPNLWLDRNQFQQVLFNLLSNAIKYADNDPNDFRVEIEGAQRYDTEFVTGKAFVIWFRDWGPGIQEGMQNVIFDEGIRGEVAIMRDVTGQGLGLWVVQRVVERHGGTIEVTNLRSPTEFKISLPQSLQTQPPL